METGQAVNSGFLEANGTRFYYEMAGEGEPLLLIHGFNLDNRMWDEQVAALAESYKVIRFDLRGFGKTPATNLPLRYTMMYVLYWRDWASKKHTWRVFPLGEW